MNEYRLRTLFCLGLSIPVHQQLNLWESSALILIINQLVMQVVFSFYVFFFVLFFSSLLTHHYFFVRQLPASAVNQSPANFVSRDLILSGIESDGKVKQQLFLNRAHCTNETLKFFFFLQVDIQEYNFDEDISRLHLTNRIALSWNFFFAIEWIEPKSFAPSSSIQIFGSRESRFLK